MRLIQSKLRVASLIIIVVAMIAGVLFSQHERRERSVVRPAQRLANPVERSTTANDFASNSARDFTKPKQAPQLDAPAIENEMLVRFPDARTMQAFLDKASRIGARIVATIPRLNAVRISFDSAAQGERIRALVPQDAAAGFNYIVATPAIPDPSKAESGGPYAGFGADALSWLGVPADNSKWGEGVKVAVLDTGVTRVPGLLGKSITQLNLVGETSDGASDSQDHGTAVASIIAGTAPEARGVAPSAELLSIRVLDANGVGDSFTAAQGIMDAVERGARVISVSLGSYGDSMIVRDAVNYALAHDTAIVAAVGNDGIGTLVYPARYPGVIAVTAVDANGQRGEFANFGPEVAIAAPGMGVYTPWSADEVINFSGTSAAVPFVSGALAGILSQNPNMTAAEATHLLLQYANDAGAPGFDPMFGIGILSVDRVLNRNKPGINDASVADVYYDFSTANNGSLPLEITVQNRGTTALSSVRLDVNINQRPMSFYVGRLEAGEIASEPIVLDSKEASRSQGVRIDSRVRIDGASDANPRNDAKSVVVRVGTK